MQEKYRNAIIAGIYGSIVILFLVIVDSVATILYLYYSVDHYGYNYTIYDTSYLYLLLTLGHYLLYLVYAVIFLAVGALAVRMAANEMKHLEDGVVAATIAGATASLLYSLGNAFVNVIAAFITLSTDLPRLSGASIDNNVAATVPLLGAAIAGVIDLACCMPVFLVIGTILALIGGIAYWLIFLRNSLAVPAYA